MKSLIKYIACAGLLFVTFVSNPQQSQAQALRIVAANTFSGALTGATLGAATMALQDNSEVDYTPLRIGVGLGTIMGLGTGFYDLARVTGDTGYFVQGYISSANSTGTIIFLDTFYGTATGAVVGAAIGLMTRDRDVVKGLQYGAGGGAWAGFVFGLVDGFSSTAGQRDSVYQRYSSSNSEPINGLFELRSDNNNYAIGFLNPIIFSSKETSTIGVTSKANLGIEFTRLNIAL